MATDPVPVHRVTPPPANWLDQAPAIVWTTDIELRFSVASGELVNSSQSAPQLTVGASLIDFMATDNATYPSIDAHRRALQGESVGYTQDYFGQVYQAHVAPLRDATGRIVGTVGAAINITELYQAQSRLRADHDSLAERDHARALELEAVNARLQQDISRRELIERELRESEERFRVIAESIALPVVITRMADGLILYANERVRDDYPESGELVGRRSIEFMHDPSERQKIYEILMREGRVRDYVVRAKSAPDLEKWVSLCMQPITYNGEQATLTSFLDVTARHEAEEALRNERNLLIRLLDLNQRDRQLIAYEIHDGIVQDITAASMFIEAATAHLPAENTDAQQAATQGGKLLRDAIDEARRLIGGLCPEVLSEAGVIAAVESLIGEMREVAEIDVEFVHEGELGRLAPALEMAIFRIVQESLNNVRQHSGSTRARVEMIRGGEHLDLLIRDWGRGFDLKKVSKKRYGLTGIRERAKLLGGSAVLTSTLGEGTTIRVRLPLVDILGVDLHPRGTE